MRQEEVWDKIARPWKEFRNFKVSHITNFLKDKKGKVLDLGCGSGRNFYEIKGVDFYGVDFSARMVELSKERGIAIEVKKGDVGKIPYGDGFFDYIIFNAALHCVKGKKARKKALNECYRVLRNEGEMVISVWGRKQKRIKNKEKECFVPWDVEGEKVLRYTYIYDAKELKSELEEAGFLVESFNEGKNLVFIVRKG